MSRLSSRIQSAFAAATAWLAALAKPTLRSLRITMRSARISSSSSSEPSLDPLSTTMTWSGLWSCARTDRRQSTTMAPPFQLRMAAATLSGIRRRGKPRTGPGDPEQGPELEGEVVLEIGHVDHSVHDHRDQGQHDAELNRLPGSGRGPPTLDAHPKTLHKQSDKRGEPEQACLGPEVQHDVMRIDQVFLVDATAVGLNALGEAEEASAEDRMVAQHLQGRLPQVRAREKRVIRVGRVELMGEPRPDARLERCRNTDQQDRRYQQDRKSVV